MDMAHIPRWSGKLRRLIRPSHKGVGWFYAIPLCREHHLEQHRIGYEKFSSKYFQSSLEPYRWIAQTLASLLDILPPECDSMEVCCEWINEEVVAHEDL